MQTKEKDWTGNSKSVFLRLGSSNHSPREREQHDYYATDPIAIDLLTTKIRLPDVVYEPACGEGHLSERLKQYGCKVYSADLIDRGYGEVKDFFDTTSLPEDCSCIITNPPYKYATEFILHSLEILPEGGYCFMLLNNSYLEGKTRYEKIYKQYPPMMVACFVRRLRCSLNGMFDKKLENRSAVPYSWFVWRKGYVGRPLIEWLV